MLIIRYFIDVISLVFIVSLVYLMVLWTFFLESAPQYDFTIFRIVFLFLGAWMVAITFLGVVKIIKYLNSLMIQ